MSQSPSFKLTKTALILMAGILAGCATNEQQRDEAAEFAPQTNLMNRDEAEMQRLEKCAVSQCLIQAFPDSEMENDAHRASGGYVQLGTSPAELYDEIEEMVKVYRTKPYNSKSGKSLFVMQCLDLLQDPALQALIRPE